MKKTDKRKFPRLQFSVDVQYQIVRGKSAKALKSRTRNISEGGLCMMLLEKVRAGTILSLEFRLPDTDSPIAATGKVVWVEKLAIISAEAAVSYDCGVVFVDIAPGDREKIGRHVMLRIK